LATNVVGFREVDEASSHTPKRVKQKSSKVNSFITDLMKKDREFYDRLLALMRFFNLINVDLSLVS